jgi:hypothetical protein
MADLWRSNDLKLLAGILAEKRHIARVPKFRKILIFDQLCAKNLMSLWEH